LRLAELVAVEVESAEIFAERLGVERDETGLLATALVHPSYTPEGGLESNQRLEFLGDAVLDLVIAEVLLIENPSMNEGDMSKARIQLVNESMLAEIAASLDLGSMLLMGRGADLAGDRTKPSVLSDALEAVFGALYLSKGLESVRRVILQLFGDRIAEAAAHPGSHDYKSLLNEWASTEHEGEIAYEVSSSGPDHDRHFVAVVLLGTRVLGTGEGHSKKAAETEAAKAAWGVVQSA
jgi:ribonuclease-3